MLLLKCPATGHNIQVGIEMDKKVFRTAVLSPGTVRCPKCDRDHTWYKSDLFFDRRLVPRAS